MSRDVGDSTVEDLDHRISASREVRREFEGQWLLNIAFYVGNQWVRFDGLMLAPYIPEDEYEPLIVDNRIQPAVRTEIAKETKTQPQWIGVPKDGTDEEQTAARLREHVFEHYWRVLRARRLLRRARLWSKVGAAGFIKATWDSNTGSLVRYMARPNEQTGQLEPVTMADGRMLTPDRLEEAAASGMPLDPNMVEQRRRTGDVRLDLRSPFATFPDALVSEEGLESAEWIGEEHVYSCDQLWKMLGGDDDAWAKVEQLEQSTQATAGIAESFTGRGFGMGRRGGSQYRGIRVREYWSLPNYDHSEGRHAIWVPGQQMLLEEGNDYGWLPYAMFAGTPVPGRFWPDCMTTQLVPLNTELNKHESQVASNAERVGNPPLRQAADSLPDDEDEDQPIRPGEKLIYRETGGQPPEYMNMPDLASFVQNRRAEIEQSIKEVSRQYEVTTGTVPAGVTAASAISLLQESSDTVLSPDIDDMSDSLLDLGQKVLGMVKRFATGEQIARVAGEEGGWDIVRFRGDELGDMTIDEVQIGSGIPDSRAGKQAAIDHLLNLLIQNGQAPKPRDLRRVLRDYDIAGLEHILGSLNKDEDQILDENRRLFLGEGLEKPQPVITNGPTGPIPIFGPDGKPLLAGMIINPFDDDQVHVEGHQEACKSATYRELGRRPGGQAIQQGILAHIELHKARLAERAASIGQAQANDVAPLPSTNGATAPPA